MREKLNFRIASNIVDYITSREYPPIVSFALALIFCICSLNSGCAPKRDVSGPSNPNADAFFDEINFNGKTIEAKIRANSNLLPSHEFWFASGDDKTLIYGWNEVIFREREAGVASCNHPMVSPGCRQCDVCSGMCNDFSGLGSILSTPDAIATLKKSPANGQFTDVHNFYSPLQGCLMQPRNNAPFTTVEAENDFYYLLRHVDFVSANSSAFERTIFYQTHIISTPRTITREMESYRDAADPTTLRFKFTMPEIDGKLAENFSEALKVTKVRILLGTKDSSTNAVMISKDPESLRKVRPSRILFLPSFVEGNINNASSERTNRCYLDPNIDDGDFNLDTCRRSPFTTTITPFLNGATPTFERGRNMDTLTWVIEYKTSDGLPAAEALKTNEFPIIEWTVQ